MEFLTPPLENELVSLVRLKATDFESLFRVAADPEIWAQHPVKDRYQREVFHLYFEAAVASGTAYMIREKAQGQPIGCTRFYNFDATASSVAIGYTFLAKAYWGGTYNQAVKSLMIAHAFRYVPVVLFHVAKENLRSQKALLKIGAEKTGEVDFEHYGENMPHFEYRITRPSS